jgi:hypothetical protein
LVFLKKILFAKVQNFSLKSQKNAKKRKNVIFEDSLERFDLKVQEDAHVEPLKYIHLKAEIYTN